MKYSILDRFYSITMPLKRFYLKKYGWHRRGKGYWTPSRNDYIPENIIRYDSLRHIREAVKLVQKCGY